MNKSMTKEMDIIISKFDNKNKKKTLVAINKMIMVKGRSERFISKLFSLAKKEMKKHTNDLVFLKSIKPDDKLTKRILAKNTEIRDNKKMLVVNRDMLITINSLSNSTDVNDLVIYLMLMSGRRINEVIHGEFRILTKSKNIYFKGMLKRKNNKDKEYEIQTLNNKSNFMKVYKKFKRILKFKKSKTLNNTVNRKLKKLFGKDIRSHSLRGIYANYLFKFNNPNNWKINTFLMNVLGHTTSSTSLSYTGYEINFENKIKFK